MHRRNGDGGDARRVGDAGGAGAAIDPLAPTISVSDATPLAGDPITISGTGCTAPAGSADPDAVRGSITGGIAAVQVSATPDASGNWSATVVVARSVGSHPVVLIGCGTLPTSRYQILFRYPDVPLAVTPRPPPGAELSVVPNPVPAGAVATVRAVGCTGPTVGVTVSGPTLVQVDHPAP